MCNPIYYCSRNEVKQYADQINDALETNKANSYLQQTYCMKLCMLCDNRLVVAFNNEVCVAKDKNELIENVLTKIENNKVIHSSI